LCWGHQWRHTPSRYTPPIVNQLAMRCNHVSGDIAGENAASRPPGAVLSCLGHAGKAIEPRCLVVKRMSRPKKTSGAR
jgi:hypothetical protein